MTQIINRSQSKMNQNLFLRSIFNKNSNLFGDFVLRSVIHQSDGFINCFKVCFLESKPRQASTSPKRQQYHIVEVVHTHTCKCVSMLCTSMQAPFCIQKPTLDWILYKRPQAHASPAKRPLYTLVLVDALKRENEALASVLEKYLKDKTSSIIFYFGLGYLYSTQVWRNQDQTTNHNQNLEQNIHHVYLFQRVSSHLFALKHPPAYTTLHP